MTPAHPTPVIALSNEPSYSAQEAAAMLGRSFSWLDQRLRTEQFVRPDGTVVVPLRTPGGYRRFTLTMLKDIAGCCYLKGWFSVDKLRSRLSCSDLPAVHGDAVLTRVSLIFAGWIPQDGTFESERIAGLEI
jgi:hypothetical protein